MVEFEATCSCMGKSLERFLQPTILMLLAKEKMHGFAILKEIGESPLFRSGIPDPSGLYRYLKKMEQQGLLQSIEVVQVDFPSKRVYEITPMGRECLRQWTETLTEYSRNLVELTKLLETGCI